MAAFYVEDYSLRMGDQIKAYEASRGEHQHRIEMKFVAQEDNEGFRSRETWGHLCMEHYVFHHDSPVRMGQYNEAWNGRAHGRRRVVITAKEVVLWKRVRDPYQNDIPDSRAIPDEALG